MIRGVHTMFYTSEPGALRAFLRDKLDLSATDVGDGWLIFPFSEAEMGCHPTETQRGEVPSGTAHISFYCDDLAATMTALRKRGVDFAMEPEDHGYGLVTEMRAPGGFTIQLYQPHYSV